MASNDPEVAVIAQLFQNTIQDGQAEFPYQNWQVTEIYPDQLGQVVGQSQHFSGIGQQQRHQLLQQPPLQQQPQQGEPPLQHQPQQQHPHLIEQQLPPLQHQPQQQQPHPIEQQLPPLQHQPQQQQPHPIEQQLPPLQHQPQQQQPQLIERQQPVPIGIRPLYPQQSLDAFLKVTGSGKEVIASYLKNNNRLSKPTRSKLARIVIKRDIDYILQRHPPGTPVDKIEISPERLEFLSREIANTFEGEVATVYYKKGFTENGVHVNPGGKFFHHLTYRRTTLQKDGILRSRPPRPRNNTEDDNVDNNVDNVGENDPAIDEQIQWLKSNLDPWRTVTSCWRDTFNERRRLLKGDISVENYFQTFPCLRTNQGFTLIEQDFNRLYPGRENILNDKWPIIKRVILEELKLKTFRNVHDKALILSLDNLSPKNQDAIILHLLPYVISPFVQRRKRKRAENVGQVGQQIPKDSIDDRRNQFFYCIKNAADVNTVTGHIRETLHRQGEKFQPTIIGVGDLVNLNQFFVYVNEFSFEFDNCVEALDAALKVYFAVDCQYPNKSASLWTFFQKAGHNISLTTDKTNSSIDVLIGRIQRSQQT